ncbi:asb133 [Agrotis segetum nucleopolyhedrovirus B]|uniref:Asb133 n=1 Tax=Agrotis segetum nucleopolyhedrovirus B TaxID=1580580 RepID=A0A0A7KVH1_9ABAC|nr:asb133 [Agrotis segetum nucleopolyhedrovirus B]AIZ48690.1 asb133 [Agrotis segetum nucleopolyhedrovirus B]
MDKEFQADLKDHIDKITTNHAPDPKSRLGDVIQHMGRNSLLLQRKKDEDFSINLTHAISDVSRDYLNLLQTEKLSECRLCYHNDDSKRCEFHKKYIFTKDPKVYADEYVNFLNSEMGIISFVELYYSYLSVPFWRMASVTMMRDLTGFSSIKELLTYYNYECDEDVDVVPYEIMDCE